MKGETVRAVLLERIVLQRDAKGAAAVAIFGRALWAFSSKVEVKMWVVGGGDLGDLAKRSRSTRGVADPLRAQEWAFGVWDEYVREVRAAWERARGAPVGSEPRASAG